MFCVLLKLMERVGPTKGKDGILDAISNKDLLEKMQVMHSFRPHLKMYAEILIYKLCQFPAYYKMLTNEINYEVFVEIFIRW